jgi:uroporphyrinogen-III synthase
MTDPDSTTVAIAAAAGTLTDLEDALRRTGHPVVRFDALRFQPVLSAARRKELRRATWDGIVVSSPRGLELFLEPVFGSARRGKPNPVAYVAGESTAVGAERLGYTVVRPVGPIGMDGIVRAVPGDRRLRLLHPRSDIAGPKLSRNLRAAGHTVRDVVAFRTMKATSMPSSVRAGFARAGLVVVTSPSALRSLRRHLGPEVFRQLVRAAPFRVLGGTTEKAVRLAGARDIALLDPGPGQRFTPATVGSLFDGRPPSG